VRFPSGGDVGCSTSIALDESNHPHISYYDWLNRDLKYARLMPCPLLDKQAAPSDGVRNNDTLTYTLTLSGPGLNVRLWDPLPASVHYITDSVAPPAVYSPTVNAVVWQGTLPIDTVQVIRFQVTPGITGTGSLSLSLPIVNTAWMTETESGASVSATVIVNGWRVYLPLALRGYVVMALGSIGPEAAEAVPALAQALEDENWEVREAAALALNMIGPAALEAVPALIQALGDENDNARASAAWALTAITGQNFQNPAAWQQWWEAQ